MRGAVKFEIVQLDEDDKYNSIPLVTARINMVSVRFLIDTGASISFIDAKFAKKHIHLKNFITKCTMEGGYSYENHHTSKNSDKEISTKDFKLGKTSFEHRFLLANLNGDGELEIGGYDAILGFDFFMKHNIVMDCATRRLHFDI